MALPTLAKTWNYSVNQQLAASGSVSTDLCNIYFKIKEGLVATGSWTVRASCTGSAVSTTGDLWATAANVTYGLNVGTNAHSWCVLRNTSLGSTFEICLQMGGNNSIAGVHRIGIAPGGYNYATGSTVNRPTATNADEIQVGNTTLSGPLGSTSYASVVHVMSSSDGQCTRWIIYSGEQPAGMFLLDKANTSVPTSKWAIPFVWGIFYSGSQSTTISTTNTFSTVGSGVVNAGWNTRYASTGANVFNGLFGSCETYNGNLVTSGTPSDFTGEYVLQPINLVSNTAGSKGRHGSFFDLWQGPSGLVSGSTFDGVGSMAFALHGCLVTPWNGSAIVTR